MSDGPFRNSELSSRWKRYGKELISDAATPGERTMLACHSMLGDVDMNTFSPLLKELQSYAACGQIDLDPVTAIEAIFENNPRSPWGDSLQRYLIANLRDQIQPLQALEQALESATTEWINITKNRLDEECIRARDLGDMKPEQYGKGIERNRQAFAAVDPRHIREALITGNKRAFKYAVEKKTGIDQGPEE